MMEETYRKQLNALVQRVNELPQQQREALEQLVAETTMRHQDIADASQQSEAALERLTVTLQLGALANASMLDAANRLRNS